MAQRAIKEYHAKKILQRLWKEYFNSSLIYSGRAVEVTPLTDLECLRKENDWLGKEKLVVKVDQLIGKRKKHGLMQLNIDFNEAQLWIQELMGKIVTIDGITGVINQFIIEPFLAGGKEYYLAIRSERKGDVLYFSSQGGADIEENWAKVVSVMVPVRSSIRETDYSSKFLDDLSPPEKDHLNQFIEDLFHFYEDLHFTFLEFNPLFIKGNQITPLDCKARVDDTAAFLCAKKWGELSFPPPFGRQPFPEELYIKELDERTGASLKLSILNPKGRIWTMSAGGGASIVYTDTIVDLGFANELGNYGEYSGNPPAEIIYKYARTVLDLFTRGKDPEGRDKILLIGGGIANFTDVAQTLEGITQALIEYREQLQAVRAKIYVRRGGPNWRAGLQKMSDLGKNINIPIEVYGPDTPMTKIVSLALGQKEN